MWDHKHIKSGTKKLSIKVKSSDEDAISFCNGKRKHLLGRKIYYMS